MTVKELIAQAEITFKQPQAFRICAEGETSGVDCENIESLIISHDYIGQIPSMSMFPRLKKLHILKCISLPEFEKLDLSAIDELYVIFKKTEPVIKLNLPKIKKLSIYINDNEDNQLNSFNVFDALIDIRGCDLLEELNLRHCTGYTIKTNTLLKLRNFICYDYKKYNFEVLNFTPNLVHFVAIGCGIEHIDFLKLIPNVTYLDLSYNEIKDASQVLEMTNLQSLNIFKNPLNDTEKYQAWACKTIVTDKDRDLESFLSSVRASSNLAYSTLKSARKINPQRNKFLQHTYDTQTDEEIFIRYFASNVKRDIEYYTSPENNGESDNLLMEEELVECVLNEYPFLMECFRPKVEEM